MGFIITAKFIIALILFFVYILFAGLVGYDLARHKFINAWACILVCAIFLVCIMICVVI